MNFRQNLHRNLGDLFRGCASRIVLILLVTTIIVLCLSAPAIADLISK